MRRSLSSSGRTKFTASYIDKLVNNGVSAGCGGGNYCPGASVPRAQAAVFLVRAFNLP